MRNRRQVIPIRQQHQKQQTQSISLNSDSMPRQNQSQAIEEYQYGDLDFSDQVQRELQSSEEEKQLRPEQIRNVIDVDRLNQYYLSRKSKEISQTRAGISQYMHQNMERTNQDQRANYQKSIQKAYQNSSMPQNQLFNINSFLNSRPVNKNRGNHHRRVQSQREKNNSNAFEKVLKQHSKNKNGKINKKYNLFPDEEQKSRNSTSNPYKAKNQKIRQFIQAYSKKHIQFNKSKPSVTNQSQQQSITLISLPQPPQFQPHQPSHIPYHLHNRHPHNNKNMHKHKAQSLIHKHKHNHNIDYNQYQFEEYDDETKAKLFELRFQTAKINFMDSFLPESMKIGNNAYNYWKYTNSKNNNKYYGSNFGNRTGLNLRII